jgi:hypothetical protein
MPTLIDLQLGLTAIDARVSPRASSQCFFDALRYTAP